MIKKTTVGVAFNGPKLVIKLNKGVNSKMVIDPKKSVGRERERERDR